MYRTNKVLLVDFDDCLAVLDDSAGITKMTEMLSGIVGRKRAFKTGEAFEDINNSINLVFRGKADKKMNELVDELNSYRIGIPKEIAGKDVNFMWSRQLWLKYISDKHDLKLDGKTIMKITESFWLAASMPLYPDAKEFLRKSDTNKIFVVTGSDRNILLNDDSMVYDPEYSRRLKIARLLKQSLGMLPEENMITGDPFDKPSPEFWENVMKRTGITKPSEGIFIDDSLLNVKDAMDAGFVGVLMDREKNYKNSEVTDRVDAYISSFSNLSSIAV